MDQPNLIEEQIAFRPPSGVIPLLPCGEGEDTHGAVD